MNLFNSSFISILKKFALVAAVGTPFFLTAAEWTPLKLVPSDSIDERAYERVTPDNYAASLQGWKADDNDQTARAKVSEIAGRKGKAVRTDFTFVGKDKYEYVSLKREVPIPQPGLIIGMWCRFEDVPGRLRLRVVDASGEYHQLEFINPITLGEWKFYAAPIQNRSDAWDGDGNKKVDYPAKFFSLVYDRPHRGYHGSGSLSIDEFYLMKPREKLPDLISAKIDTAYGNTFTDAKESIHLKLSALDPSKGAVEVTYQIQDFWNNSKGKGTLSLTGEESQIRIPRSHNGYHFVEIETRQNGVAGPSYNVRGDWNTPFPIKTISASFFGLCTHYRLAKPDYYPLESMPMIAHAGAKHLRDEISWSSLEREKGVFVFEQVRK